MTKEEIFEKMLDESIGDNTTLDEEIESTINESSEDQVETDSKIQKLLNKLMSEEKLAVEFYLGCIIASERDVHNKFKDLFIKIAEDEEKDHFISLLHWAKSFGYAVPFKNSDFRKFASGITTKLIDQLKTKQDAMYYVGEAIKSEEDAIKSYSEAMKYENIPYELNMIFMNSLADEKEHLEKLNTLKLALEADATLYLY